MSAAAAGQVHKVIRVVATSPTSWERATRNGIAEAAKSIVDLAGARVVELDTVVDEDSIVLHRVKLEMTFQLDRSRMLAETNEIVRVARYLIVANHTLASPALLELVHERIAAGPSEFHVLLPEPRRALSTMVGDPTVGYFDESMIEAQEAMQQREHEDAQQRLDEFMAALTHLGRSVTSEIGVGDPLTATRNVMERASFDEIIVSTLPAGASRWLKLDLPTRLRRAFDIPVVPVIHVE